MSETMIVKTPADVEKELPVLTAWARGLTITNSAEFADAGEKLKGIKGAMKRVVDFFKPTKQAQDEAKRRILAAEKELLDPLTEAEALAKRAMLTFQQAEAAKAEAERRRLQALADEQARKEREKAEQEAAKQRQIEAEARAKAEAARQAALQASEAERKKLLAEAEAADRKANAAAVKGETKTEQAAAAVAPVIHVASTAQKIAGVTTKKVWTFQIVDASLVPREYLDVSEKRIGQYARMMREGAVMAGVKFFAEESLSSRGT